jgi:hypothetical protein
MEYIYISAVLVMTSQPSPRPCNKVYMCLSKKYDKLNYRFFTRQNLYQPKYGLVVTITLEFLDKDRMELCTKCHTHDSIPAKTNTLLQSSFEYTIN